MIEALASMRPHGEPKYRPADATHWTVINRHPDPETRHDVDTLNAAVDQAMTLFEDPTTTTVEINDNIGRIRYTISATDL